MRLRVPIIAAAYAYRIFLLIFVNIFLMKILLLKFALRVLKACCDWLSDYIGTLPSNAISNALKCAPFSDD